MAESLLYAYEDAGNGFSSDFCSDFSCDESSLFDETYRHSIPYASSRIQSRLPVLAGYSSSGTAEAICTVGEWGVCLLLGPDDTFELRFLSLRESSIKLMLSGVRQAKCSRRCKTPNDTCILRFDTLWSRNLEYGDVDHGSLEFLCQLYDEFPIMELQQALRSLLAFQNMKVTA